MTFRSTKLIDWFLLLSCNLMWASQFVMVKLVQQQMGPLFAVTFPIALSTLLLIVLVGRKPGARHNGARPLEFRIARYWLANLSRSYSSLGVFAWRRHPMPRY